MASVFLESAPAFLGLQHMYLVYRADDGREWVIRGGPQNVLDSFLSTFKIELNLDIRLSRDTRDANTDDVHRTVVTAETAVADALWSRMVEYARLVEAGDVPYELLFINCNALVGAALEIAGLDAVALVPETLTPASIVGYDERADLLALLPYTGDGSLQGGDDADMLAGIQIGDRMFGHVGDDWLDGGEGGDTLAGGDGADTLIGGDGADTLDGGANPETQGDILLGGAGGHTYLVDSALDFLDEGAVFADAGGGGVDTVLSSAAFFFDINGVGETLVVARADGGTLVGGANANTLVGSTGNDVLAGGFGADRFEAGDGVDWLLLGSVGEVNPAVLDVPDTVVIAPRTNGDFSYDIALDFLPGHDRLDVSAFSAQNGFATGADVIARAIDDGAGNVYIPLGDGLDYLYIVGWEKAALSGSDFVV